MILVTGATGNAGGAVVRALRERGESVRALMRRASSRALPDGVEVAEGDLDHAETLKPHLSGVSAVFLLAGYGGLRESLAAMSDAGVERVVLLSSSAAPSRDLSNAIARYHIESEDAVRAAGIPWTFLQPNSFMSNAFRWLAQLRAGDIVRLPFADARVAMIDPADLGSVAAAALREDVHHGQAYRLSGPESLRPADQVAAVGELLGRELRFEAQPDDEAREEMSRSMPPEYVDAFFRFFVDGTLDESQVLPTVEAITGRPPRSFRQWTLTHADEIRRAAGQ
jgi:uncharacterized protein YbjT (DUF2867 family)